MKDQPVKSERAGLPQRVPYEHSEPQRVISKFLTNNFGYGTLKRIRKYNSLVIQTNTDLIRNRWHIFPRRVFTWINITFHRALAKLDLLPSNSNVVGFILFIARCNPLCYIEIASEISASWHGLGVPFCHSFYRRETP